MFWMNMLHAQKANWAGYCSRRHSRRSEDHVTVNSPTQLTFTLTGPVNSYWFTYNELSQITPMPAPGTSPRRGRKPVRVAVLGRALRDGRHRVHCRLHLPVQAGRLQPGQPERDQQLAVDLRHQPDLAGGRRAVAADPLRRHRQRHHGPQSDLFGPGQAHHQEVHRAARTRRIRPSSTHWSGGKVNVGYLPSQDITAPTTNPWCRAQQPPV